MANSTTEGTGFFENVDHIKNRETIEVLEGDHYWVVTAMYVCNPTTSLRILLDHESLIFRKGPFCLACQKDFSPEVAKEKCQG